MSDRRTAITLAMTVLLLLGRGSAEGGPPQGTPPIVYRIAIADLAVNRAGETPIRVIDSNGVVLDDIWVGATHRIEPFAISDDESMVALDTGPGMSHELRLFDRRTGQSQTLLTGGWGFNALKWLPGSSTQFLFVSSETGDGNINRFDTTTGNWSVWQNRSTATAAIGHSGYGFRFTIAWDAIGRHAAFQAGRLGGAGDGVLLGDFCDGGDGQHVCNLRVLDLPQNWYAPYSAAPTLTSNGDIVYYTRWDAASLAELIRFDLTTWQSTVIATWTKPILRPTLFDNDARMVFVETQLSDRDSVVVCNLEPYACQTVYRSSAPILHLQVLGPRVPDTTPPVLSLPQAIVADASTSQGANVHFVTSAVDDVDGPVAVNCSPSSGSLFPIGVTSVSCAASDAAGNESTGTFTVTVVEAVTVRLIDSGGGPIAGASVQFYSGSWQSFGVTGSDGAVRKVMPLRSYVFRMVLGGGVQDKAQNVAADTTVTYQTTRVTVQLRSSANLPLDQGSVQYYAGAWRPFGTTVGGEVSMEMLPLSYSFRMTYAGGVQDKVQHVASSAVVQFNTKPVTVRLKDSTNRSVDPGTVQYYAGAWRPFGATSGGLATLELLPLSYTFRMTYLGGVQDKAANTATTDLVDFVTAVVHSESGLCSGYYAGTWRAFTQHMELLPATYAFRFADGAPNASYTVSAGVVNNIR